MNRLLAASLALSIFACAVPALADHDGDRGHDRGRAHGRDWDRDAHYREWQRGHRRFRRWHERDVTYYGGRWGYWEPRNGVHIFISVRL